MSGVTATLADFVVSHRYDGVPAAVRHEATRSVLNWVACAVGASHHETVSRALAALEPLSGPRQATVLGRGDRVDMMLAALMNGISSHTFDFDDTHLRTVIHPTGPVASALLAMAETRRIATADFVHAFILGVEVECRIGNAVYPSHYDVGWHITGTAGVFGAAAAVGRILGLDAERMTWALGIAATQASGLREMFGTMCKPFHPGNAARNGLTAALLAQQGFTSSLSGIEAPRGFANVLATARDYDQITNGLGETWELSLNTYKPFACGIVIHPTIDGCIQLRDRHHLIAHEIDTIALDVHPLVLELTGKTTPMSGLEGKFSVYHSAAVAIIHGGASEDQYSDECVVEPQVVALRRRVTAVVDTRLAKDQARVVITLKNGTRHEIFIEHAIGSMDRPMTDAELEQKFRTLTTPVLGAAGAEFLLRECWNLPRVADPAQIARAAVPAAVHR